MSWTQPFQVLRPSGPFADLDRHRAWRPSVLQGDGPVLRMWYAGHDGSTGRILVAEQHPRLGWTRLGVTIEPGFAGATDAAAVDAPSVVRTAAGYLMAYAGSDGTATRIHLATSVDGLRWEPLGPVDLPGGQSPATPCLVAALDRLWLYYAAEGDDRRTAILAATSAGAPLGAGSTNGAGAPSWHHVGPVLEPADGERSVSEPWVLADERRLFLFFVARDADGCPAVTVATSEDGRTWARRPTPLNLGRRHHDAGRIGGPSAVRLRGGHLQLWYAAGDEGDEAGGCRLWATDLNGKEP